MHSCSLFERRSHQNDKTGEGDEGEMPSYANRFVEFSQFIKERTSSLASDMASRWHNIRVNRSVIGQQLTLSSLYNPTLNKTMVSIWEE